MSTNDWKELIRKHKYSLIKYGIWCVLALILSSLIMTQQVGLNTTKLIENLQVQPLYKHLLYLLIGLIAVSATTLYDFILCHDFHLKINPKRIFQISWLADIPLLFAEDQVKRKGGFRYLLYKHEGIAPKQASLISIVKNIFLIGDTSNLPRNFRLSVVTRLKLILGFIIKWLAAGLFFIYIFYNFYPHVPQGTVFLIFACGMMIANLTLVPAAFGIFELFVLYGCLLIGIPIQITLLPLITFRIFYYVIPWLITMIILSRKSSTHTIKQLSASQKQFLNAISIKSLAALTFFAGCLLILSASLPETSIRLQIIPESLTLEFLHFSRIVSLGIGLLLIVLSKGIWDKVIASYYITLVLLLVGALFALLKGFHYEIALILLIIAWVLKPTKHIFYRMSTQLTLRSFVYSLSLITLSSSLYSVVYYWIAKDNQLFIVFDSAFYTVMQVILVISFIVGGSILLTLLSAKHATFEATTEQDFIKLKCFLEKYSGNSMTHLIFLKDKSLFYTMDDQVLIAFRPYKDKLIVLGDPIGEVNLFKDAINAFRLFADQYHMVPIFYEINEDYLPIYHENGFKFLKLGEEATMELSEFTLIGKKGAALRTIKNKMLRGELTFELLQNPLDQATLLKLKQISDLWLEGRREKEFSLGSFDQDYINLAPVGIVKQDEEIIAFATIMPMYSEKIVSIDLMRLIPNPPNGTMDALFIGLIEWAIDEGYEKFVLGKAPLSNVGYTQFSPTKEKIVKYIYQYGNKIYSFKGLRRYKEKFYPHWKGIYLAYPKHANLSMSLIQLTKMISGSDSDIK